MNEYVYIYIYIHTYIYAYTCVCIYIYIYIAMSYHSKEGAASSRAFICSRAAGGSFRIVGVWRR